MAKQSGLGDNLWVDEFDLSGDINSLGRVGGGPAALELTGINRSAFERGGGKRDGAIEMVSFFNTAIGAAHPTLKTRPVTDRQVTYLRGTAFGGEAAMLISKQVNYDPTRDDDANLTLEVASQANAFGLEWGNQLTSGRDVYAGAQAGAGLDSGGVTTNFGLQAYLHVFAFSGTSATAAIQSSTDNGGGDPYSNVTGAVFTAVTAVGVQRIATAGNQAVERWLRVNVTGTFSNLDFGVIVVRNIVAVAF